MPGISAGLPGRLPWNGAASADNSEVITFAGGGMAPGNPATINAQIGSFAFGQATVDTGSPLCSRQAARSSITRRRSAAGDSPVSRRTSREKWNSEA